VAVIETMAFVLHPDADEEAFLAADRRVQTEFAYQQPGLLRRTTARDDTGGWIVIDLWETEADADAMATRWDDAPAPAAFMALVAPDSVEVRRYRTLD
jgi:hypothetical protein